VTQSFRNRSDFDRRPRRIKFICRSYSMEVSKRLFSQAELSDRALPEVANW
jgi:hypothetical protein